MRVAPPCVCLALLALPGYASGFQLKRTDAGDVVGWGGGGLRLLAAPGLDALTGDGSASRALVEGALAPWTAVGSSLPMEAGSTTLDGVGYDRGSPGSNRSVVTVVDRLPEGVPDGLAVTFVTYDPATAEILDADVVVRTQGVRYSTSGEHGRYDLPSVLTHEIGHALGLEHEPAVIAATMFPEIGRGETGGRTLDPDDEAGLLALYGAVPEARADGTEGTVRYGGCRAGPGAPGAWAAAALLGALALAAARRRAGRRAAIAILAACALLAHPAVAEEGLPAHFAAASARADAVVVGTVRHVESRWTGRWVETVAAIDVRGAVGLAARRVVVRTIGGEAGGIGTWVPGAARFRPGENVAVAAVRGSWALVAVGGEDAVLSLGGAPAEADAVLRLALWARPD